MDTSQQINHHATQIVQFLTQYQDGDVDSEAYHRLVVIDRENHHYQLIAMGWATPSRYIDTLLIHVQIKPDGKVWLLENSTEMHVAEELVARGIAKTNIVLGFHPPQYRALSGYAAA